MKKCKRLIDEVRYSDSDITATSEGRDLLDVIDFSNPTISIAKVLKLNYLTRDPLVDIIPGDITLDIQTNTATADSMNHVN